MDQGQISLELSVLLVFELLAGGHIVLLSFLCLKDTINCMQFILFSKNKSFHFSAILQMGAGFTCSAATYCILYSGVADASIVMFQDFY